jgi:hypothetical protein
MNNRQDRLMLTNSHMPYRDGVDPLSYAPQESSQHSGRFYPRLRGFLAAIALGVVTQATIADDFMGEYKGTFLPDSAVKLDATAKVIAEGDGYYRVVLTAPGKEGLDGASVEIYGRQFGPEVGLFGRAGGYHWNGNIKGGTLTTSSGYGQSFRLTRIESKSPKAGLKAPEGAIVLLPFESGQKADLSQWTNREWKALDNGSMQCAPGKGANRTQREFGRIEQLHLEFWLPLEPGNRGQGRANSGVYLADHYEVQVLDSFGLTHTSGDCGGLYGIARARVNASLPPETWQTYDITFEPAKLDDSGKVVEQAKITVLHNGITIHDRQEIPDKKHRLKGPLHLQDHGHPIQFRNIWVVEGR